MSEREHVIQRHEHVGYERRQCLTCHRWFDNYLEASTHSNPPRDDPICLLCDEPVWGDAAQDPVHTADGLRITHWQCSLRNVLGGIGHLIAHDYWCGAPRHDPDAGLTYRQSSLLVATWVRVVGHERVAADE